MEQKEIEKKLREHLYTDDAVADTGKLLQMIDKLPRIPMDEVVKRLNVLRKDRTKAAMQQWKNKLEEDYPDYVLQFKYYIQNYENNIMKKKGRNRKSKKTQIKYFFK